MGEEAYEDVRLAERLAQMVLNMAYANFAPRNARATLAQIELEKALLAVSTRIAKREEESTSHA